jgi:hypothetical protein
MSSKIEGLGYNTSTAKTKRNSEISSKKKKITYNGNKIRLVATFSTETLETKRLD